MPPVIPFIPLIAAAVGTAGSVVSANAQSDAAEGFLSGDDRLNVPSDLTDIRSFLSDFFTQGLGSQGGISSPLIEQARAGLSGLIGGGLEGITGVRGGPFDQLNELQGRLRPGFEDNLDSLFNSVQARFGPQGFRAGASSDLAQIASREGARAENAFTGQIASLFPQIQGNFNTSQALFQNLLQGGIQSDLSTILPLLSGATQFATAFPGSAGFPQGLGQSGLGTGLQTAAQSAITFPLLQQLLNTGSTGPGNTPPAPPVDNPAAGN